MIIKLTSQQKGITLVELLVALAIFGVTIGGIYRLFASQSRAYTIQDRVVETQQNIRSSMEILLRDLQMTGFDSDHSNSKIDIFTPVITGNDDITANYEYDNTTQYSVRYWRDAPSQTLRRQLATIKDDGSSVASPVEILLENVEGLNFTYGVDTDGDDAMDNYWINSGSIPVMAKVVAVRIRLTARPQQMAQEDQRMMSPRTLESAVTFRNLCLNR